MSCCRVGFGLRASCLLHRFEGADRPRKRVAVTLPVAVSSPVLNALTQRMNAKPFLE